MAKSIEVGDVVQLKSGGPMMTVIAKQESFICTWFDYNQVNVGDSFLPDALQLVSKEELKARTARK